MVHILCTTHLYNVIVKAMITMGAHQSLLIMIIICLRCAHLKWSHTFVDYVVTECNIAKLLYCS